MRRLTSYLIQLCWRFITREVKKQYNCSKNSPVYKEISRSAVVSPWRVDANVAISMHEDGQHTDIINIYIYIYIYKYFFFSAFSFVVVWTQYQLSLSYLKDCVELMKPWHEPCSGLRKCSSFSNQSRTEKDLVLGICYPHICRVTHFNYSYFGHFKM